MKYKTIRYNPTDDIVWDWNNGDASGSVHQLTVTVEGETFEFDIWPRMSDKCDIDMASPKCAVAK